MWLRFNKAFQIQCVFIIILLTKYSSCVEFYAEKPDYIKTCKIFEPGFTKCSTESIQGLMSHVTNEGVPELNEKLGGSMDPLKLDEVNFKGDNNQAVTLSANLTDMIVKGFSKMIIKESRISKKDYSWITKIRMPTMRIDGNYKMAGKILVIPLNGAGKIFIEIDNMDIIARTKTQLYEKGGFTFYNVTDTKVDLQISNLRTHLDNIFNGNSKEVEESTNQFFNENWKEFFEALRPLISETVERILVKILRDLFDLFPANFFIEDIPKSTELYGPKS